MYGGSKNCLILIPFRLPQISSFTLSLKCFSSDSQLSRCVDQTPASAPPPTEGRSSPSNTPVFSPSSFLLLSFAWVYIFFSVGQVLLSTLSCSACISVSEDVFLIYLWKEIYSTSRIPPPLCSILVNNLLKVSVALEKENFSIYLLYIKTFI